MSLTVQNNYWRESSMATETKSNQRGEKVFSGELSSKQISETEKTESMTPEEELEVFKKEFYEELSKINNHRTVSNMAINISEDAFKKMKEDPQYKQQILNLIQRDWGDSYAPRNCSVLITVGTSIKDYRADSWPVGYDSEFYARSQDSFYKKTSDKKDKQKELLEEYLENRAQVKKQQQEILNEKISKVEQERSRLSQSWNNERQMSQVSAAYEANIMTDFKKGEKNGNFNLRQEIQW